MQPAVHPDQCQGPSGGRTDPPLTRAELSARKATQAAADQRNEASALLRTRTENEARNRDRYRQRAAAEGRSVRPYRRSTHDGQVEPF